MSADERRLTLNVIHLDPALTGDCLRVCLDEVVLLIVRLDTANVETVTLSATFDVVHLMLIEGRESEEFSLKPHDSVETSWRFRTQATGRCLKGIQVEAVAEFGLYQAVVIPVEIER